MLPLAPLSGPPAKEEGALAVAEVLPEAGGASGFESFLGSVLVVESDLESDVLEPVAVF